VIFAFGTHSAVALIIAGVVVLCGVALVVTDKLGWPNPRARAWLLILVTSAMVWLGYAGVGFLSGPAVAAAMAVTLGALLLRQRGMWVAIVLALVGTVSIALGMTQGWLPVPDPRDIAMDNPMAWLRTTAVSMLITSVMVLLVLQVVTHLERATRRVRDEVARRREADRARSETAMAAMAAGHLETLGKLVAGVAHDFNNNLTAMLSLSELLVARLKHGSEEHRLAEEIVQSAVGASELTRRLNSYSRRPATKPAVGDLKMVLDAAVTLFEHSTDSSVQVETNYDSRPINIEGHLASLQNAVLNLLINARDAMPSGGTVTITTQPLEKSDAGAVERVRVLIQDTGTGVPDELREQIFTPFFTTKPAGMGTGLGLPGVLATVQSHGGTLGVESEVGKTVFTIELPVARQRSKSISESKQPVRGTGNILVIDDDPAIRAAAKITLEQLGYRASVSSGGKHAVELLRRDPTAFDLVVLDLMMPELNGEDTFELLRGVAPEQRVLLWSGNAAEDQVSRLLARGAIGFVEKPFRTLELSHTLAEVLTQSRPV
jgi:signal transduction histidine kinase/ActR/RegA family two-component response regulator